MDLSGIKSKFARINFDFNTRFPADAHFFAKAFPTCAINFPAYANRFPTYAIQLPDYIKVRHVLNRKKNHISDIYFSSYGHFLVILYRHHPNFR